MKIKEDLTRRLTFLRRTKEVMPLENFLKRVVFLKTLKVCMLDDSAMPDEAKLIEVFSKYDHLRTIR